MPEQLQHPDIRKRVVQARTNLILDEPFFGTLALRLKLVEDLTCKTFWTDGQSLGYNPLYVKSKNLTDAEIQGVMEHEVLHCANGHPWRRDGRDHKLFNEACDRAINPVLRDAGRKLPNGALYELDPSHAGKSAEWIYDRLPKPQQSGGGGKGQPQQQQGGNDQSQGQGQGQPNEAEQGQPNRSKNDPGRPQDGAGAGPAGKTLPDPRSSVPGHPEKNADARTGPEQGGSGAEGHKDDPLGEVRDAPAAASEHEPAPTEEEWQSAVQQAAVLAKGQGKLPASLKRFVKDASKPRHDWRSALRRFMQELARADYSFARPNTRYVAHSLYLPALRNHEVGDLAVAVDTSGSIDKVLLDQFAAEIRTIAEEVKPRRIRVIYADAAVQSEQVFERDDIVQLLPNGGGGTDFRPVFRHIATWDEPPVAVLYLTDLHGTFPETDPGIPTVWVSTYDRDTRPVPFGELLTAA